MQSFKDSYFTACIALVASCFLVTPSFAQTGDMGSGQLFDLMSSIKTASVQWDGKLQHYAVGLFWGLAVINFVWIFLPVIFKQADFSEIIGELVKATLTIAFFWMLLINSREWATAIIDSFRTAGAEAIDKKHGGLEPGDIFYTAISLADKINNVSTINPVTSIAAVFSSTMVLVGFVFIAGFMCVAIVESYIVINASVLFMGFGGSQWTREYSLSIARYGVAVGAKLFVMTLIVGLIDSSATKWAAAYDQGNASMLTMVGLSVICAYLCKTIPDLIQSVINGTSMGGGHHLGEMAAVAATAATAAASGVALANFASGTAGGSGGSAGSAISSSLGDSINSSLAGGTGSGAGGSSGFGSGGSVGSGAPLYPDAPVAPKPKPSALEAEMKRYQERVQAARNGGSSETQGPASGRSAGAAAAGGSPGTEKPSSSSSRSAVNAALKGAGTIAALTVPGMGAAGSLSLGPDVSSGSVGPTLADMGREEGTMEVDTSSAPNTIRAADSNDLSVTAPLSESAPPHRQQGGATDSPDVDSSESAINLHGEEGPNA